MTGPFGVGVRAPRGVPGAWPDLRLFPPALAAWAAAAAVLVGGAGRQLVGLCFVLGALVALVLAVRRPGALVWSLVLILVAVCAVSGVALLRAVAVRPAAVTELADQRRSAEVELVVTADPAPVRSSWGADRVRLRARLEQVRTGRTTAAVRVPVTVFAPGTWASLLPGTRVQARARFIRARFRDEAAALTVRGPPRVLRPPGALQRSAGALRAGLRRSVRRLPPDPRALVPAMVLGDTSAVPEDLEQAEQVAGLTHLTAVSGANVAVLLAAVLGVARLLGARRRLLLLTGLLTVVGFVVVARPEPSVLRAAVMGAVTLVGVSRGSGGRAPQVLAAAVLGLLLVDPWLALSVGFALSVVATGALLLVAPRWRDRLARRLPTALAEPLAVATVAHLATVPLILGLSGHVSLVAVAANLAVEPAVVTVTLCGSLATLVAPVSGTLAEWCAWPAGCGAWWVATVARAAASAPLAEVGWPTGPVGLAVLTAVSAVLLVRGPSILERFDAVLRVGAWRTFVVAPPAATGTGPAVGPAWHASTDVDSSSASRAGHGRGGSRGPARRARRVPDRRRRARGRHRRRRA